jgi:CRP-like cAMP-binding protein
MGVIGIDPLVLEDLDLFAGCAAADLDDLAPRLESRQVAAGEILMRQGEAGEWFALVIGGEAAINFTDSDGERSLGVAGAGSILGELALLRAAPRSATVVATTPLTALIGDVEAFAVLVQVTGVRDRLTRAAAQKLAAHATPVDVVLRDGSPVQLRPVLPSDRRGLEAGLAHMSPESLRRRFFSAGQPPDGILNYLVDLDYVRHFAWVAIDAEGTGVAMARYVRAQEDPTSAEIAIGIVDGFHRRGLGTLLLGALATAAASTGVVRFTGEALEENLPIRRLLERVGATWNRGEPGVMTTTVDVAKAAEILDHMVAEQLSEVARATITAADFALA